MVLQDCEFLTFIGPIKERHFIYFVQSGFLKLAVKSRMLEIATEAGALMKNPVTVDELAASLRSPGLWEKQVSICEMNTSSQCTRAATGLESIAEGGDLMPSCIIIEGNDDVRSLPIWPRVEQRSVVLEEASVSGVNVDSIITFLLQWNGLDRFSTNEQQAARKSIVASVQSISRPLPEISQQLDLLMLSPTFASELRQERKRRGDVLNECIMNFLMKPKAPSMCRLLQAVDAMKTEKLKEPAYIICDLYQATEKALRGSDRRYHHNKQNLAPPIYFLTWALRLLADERALMSSGLLEALERLCRGFMAQDDGNWLEDPTNFKKAFYPCLSPKSRVADRRASLWDAVRAVLVRQAAESPETGGILDSLASGSEPVRGAGR